MQANQSCTIGSMVPIFGAGGARSAIARRSAITYTWLANGLITLYPIQPSSFNGLAYNNPLIAGNGPFDGGRVVQYPATILVINATQRVAATAPASATSTIEIYRMRGATVDSLGTMTLAPAPGENFRISQYNPAITDLANEDVLFVSFAAVAGASAADISVEMITSVGP